VLFRKRRSCLAPDSLWPQNRHGLLGFASFAATPARFFLAKLDQENPIISVTKFAAVAGSTGGDSRVGFAGWNKFCCCFANTET
jgi:hypothetical protein